ncbi:hypothetical protein DV515_00013408 [Chloebia gouldiae]|uniref:Uncharacterized protein n=1 Tax=Chloebia gouldiae TaxID=44316 RepID=A0A3L8S1I6_CHLGU|nr:hypothetical protein DV515_00013408 [Chloebia gouldiae]
MRAAAGPSAPLVPLSEQTVYTVCLWRSNCQQLGLGHKSEQPLVPENGKTSEHAGRGQGYEEFKCESSLAKEPDLESK